MDQQSTLSFLCVSGIQVKYSRQEIQNVITFPRFLSLLLRVQNDVVVQANAFDGISLLNRAVLTKTSQDCTVHSPCPSKRSDFVRDDGKNGPVQRDATEI